MTHRLAILFVLPALLLAACATPQGAPGLLDRVERLRTDRPEQAGTMAAFLDRTMARLCGADCNRPALTDARLLDLAAAAAAVNAYHPGLRVEAHERVFAALLARGLAGPLEVRELHRTYIAARRWEDARRLVGRFPELALEPIPATIDPGPDPGGHPAVWRVSLVEDAIHREPLDLSRGRVLIVVSHPGCGFSRRALAALREPALRDRLPARTYFVVPPFGSIDIPRLRHWNAEFPTQEHRFADREGDWPFGHRIWDLPTFVLLEEGVHRATLQGWPPGTEQGERLKVLLEAEQGETGQGEAGRGVAGAQ